MLGMQPQLTFTLLLLKTGRRLWFPGKCFLTALRKIWRRWFLHFFCMGVVFAYFHVVIVKDGAEIVVWWEVFLDDVDENLPTLVCTFFLYGC